MLQGETAGIPQEGAGFWSALLGDVWNWLNTDSFWMGIASGVLVILLHAIWVHIVSWLEDRRASQSLRASIKGSSNATVDPRFRSPEHWRGAFNEASITTVVSGKGGVGKSMLALGLVEHASRNQRVLLIDFDVHNRGLTSKFLNTLGSLEHSTLYGELQTFFERYSKKLRGVLIDRSKGRTLSLADITKADYQEFLNDYCKRPAGGTRELRVLQLPARSKTLRGVLPENVFFLPCRYRNDRWIGTELSRLDFVEVALFLKSLAFLARSSEPAITRIVIDCHGAHDMFAVGAIAVADRLVVVTTADPSSYEGTAELVEFAKELAKKPEFLPESEVLVVNDYKGSESSTLNTMLEGLGKRREHVPVIRSLPVIRRRMRAYAVPTAAGIRHVWNKIVDIERGLRGGGGQSRLRVGEILVRKKVITNINRNEVLRIQDTADSGKKFGEIAVAKGYCTVEQVEEALGLQTANGAAGNG